MRTSTISLCMIVRDEEAMLDRCLAAAKPYVDEICIVDTGSVDATLEIARAHGARIREIEWPNDFAEARNHSLEMATGDWILVLDADEVLRPGDEEALNRCVDDPEVIAAFQEITNWNEEKSYVTCLILRLFRNMPDHRFEGAIHEQVVTRVLDNGQRLNMRVLDQLLSIDHYGYTETARREKNKDERNRLHFERALEKNPNDAYMWFMYGDFLRRFEVMEPVVAAFRRSVEILGRKPDYELDTLTYPAQPHALLALELIRMKEFKEARAVLTTARERMRPTPMLHWVWGHLNLQLEQWDEAFEAFKTCHALDNVPVHVPAQPGITSGRSVFGMARALLGRGEKDAAIKLFEDGAARWPDCVDLQKAMARIHIARGEFREAISLCTRFISEQKDDDAEVWQIGAEMMMQLGLWDQAGVWLERARGCLTPENQDLVFGTSGEWAFGRGEYEAAADHWSPAPQNCGCAAGLIALRIMVAEPMPGDVQFDDPNLYHALAGLLRRLHGAPRGAEAFELLAHGLKQRPLAHSRTQDLLRSHLEDQEARMLQTVPAPSC